MGSLLGKEQLISGTAAWIYLRAGQNVHLLEVRGALALDDGGIIVHLEVEVVIKTRLDRVILNTIYLDIRLYELDSHFGTHVFGNLSRKLLALIQLTASVIEDINLQVLRVQIS